MNADSMLQPGDQLIVRLAEGQAPPPTPTPPTHHVVRSGQSLWLIAALYDLTLEELMDYMPVKDAKSHLDKAKEDIKNGNKKY